jgi:hypothetical protein
LLDDGRIGSGSGTCDKWSGIPNTVPCVFAQAGSKDLILRKWKTLTDYITVECDGKDITPKLRELKVSRSSNETSSFLANFLF